MTFVLPYSQTSHTYLSQVFFNLFQTNATQKAITFVSHKNNYGAKTKESVHKGLWQA